jgi:hypothetical protein
MTAFQSTRLVIRLGQMLPFQPLPLCRVSRADSAIAASMLPVPSEDQSYG